MPQKKTNRYYKSPRKVPPDTLKPRNPARRQRIIIISIAAVLAIVIGGFVYNHFYLAPMRQPVLTVDNDTIRMDYFLKRLKMVGDASYASQVLQQLTSEEIIKMDAGSLGVTVSSAEVTSALRKQAIADLNSNSSTANSDASSSTATTTGAATATTTTATTTNTVTTPAVTSITDAAFNNWYHKQLKNTGLSDAQYREMERISLLADGVRQYFTKQIPTSTEQIDLHVIETTTEADAGAARAKIVGGESFADVAKSMSIDPATSDQGGDVGWVPRGVFGYENVTFSLAIGEVSQPVAVDSSNPSSGYYIFMVSAKDPNRPIDSNSMQILSSNALNNWITQQRTKHVIKIDYNFNSSSNQSWLEWQVSRMAGSPKTTGSTTTTTTSTTTTAVLPSNYYAFDVYSDSDLKDQLSSSSVIDLGTVQQGNMIQKKIYVKNTGKDTSYPVLTSQTDLSSGLAFNGSDATLTANGSATITLSLAAASSITTGEYNFTIAINRGDMNGGYSIFIPAKVTVTAAPPVTQTLPSTTTTGSETTTPAANTPTSPVTTTSTTATTSP